MNKDNTAGITTGYYKIHGNHIMSNGLSIAVVMTTHINLKPNGKLMDDYEQEANLKMFALAGNLSQKYGSLEDMEKRMLRAEHEHELRCAHVATMHDLLQKSEKEINFLKSTIEDREKHCKFLEDKRTMLQKYSDESLVQISDLERQVKELTNEVSLLGVAYEVMRDRAFRAESISANKFAKFIKENYTPIKGNYRHKGDFEKSGKLQNIDSVFDHFLESIKVK